MIWRATNWLWLKAQETFPQMAFWLVAYRTLIVVLVPESGGAG